MALPTGKLAEFTFEATTYDSTDCLDGWSFNDAINEVIYQCGGYDKAAAGTESVTFSISLALDNTDVTKITALAPGTTTTTFEAHPFGDTATYVEITSTDAVVISRNLQAPQNGIVMMDVQIRLNDVTVQAAS